MYIENNSTFFSDSYVQVLPIQETWYSVYRNYENDPAFGDALCPRFSSQGPEVNGSYPLLWQSVEGSV